MGRGKKALCLLAFSLVCIGLLLFLHAFTVEHNTVTYLEWSAASLASPEGEETPFDPLSPPPALGEGQVYRFRTALPPQDGTQVLLFEVDGMELAVYTGGELPYRSAAEFPPETMGQGTMQLPLPPGQGQELVMEVRPVGEGPDIFPPFPRLTDDPTDMDGVTAYANRLALPAGAAALALVLVWGLFLISLLHGQPNWSLIPLSLAALGLTVFRLSQGVGGFFLPQPVLVVCQWRGLGVLTSAALLVYLLMNRRRGFYRSFGLAALVERRHSAVRLPALPPLRRRPPPLPGQPDPRAAPDRLLRRALHLDHPVADGGVRPALRGGDGAYPGADPGPGPRRPPCGCGICPPYKRAGESFPAPFGECPGRGPG